MSVPSVEETRLNDLDAIRWSGLPGLLIGQNYARAPIVQAILEFQVVADAQLKVDALRDAAEVETFQVVSENFNVQGQFGLVDGVVTGETTGDRVGFAFQKPDGSRIIQADLGRFSFSWASQYTDWSDFINEAESAWLRYRRVSSPTMVKTIGVRFVNQIPMPRPIVEIKDYLRTSIDISPYLPQGVTNLFMQVDVPLSEGTSATITSALLAKPNVESPQVALLLDIDVKREVSAATEAAEFDALVKETLAHLRAAKNYVFEACITDATRGLIS